MTTVTTRKTRPVAVQLSPDFVRQLDRLAKLSGMTRHRYMTLLLEHAVSQDLVATERIEFSTSRSGTD
jgi:predicted transcriptional regulator